MMKRLFALLLALVMIFMLTACDKDQYKDKEPTAFELIDTAVKKTQALDSAEIVMNMDMSMDMMGMSVDVPVKYNINGIGLTSKSPKMEMVMSMSMFGMDVDYDIYVEDGYYYMSVMGENMKFKAEDASDYDGMAQVNSMFGDLTEELLHDTTIIKNADGTKTVKLSLDSDAFKKAFKELVDNTGSSAAEGASIDDLSVSNVNIEVVVNTEGYIDTYNVAFDMAMTIKMDGEEYNVSMKLDASIQYKNPGKDVTVTAPTGYKDYPEIDPDEMS